MNKLLNNKPLSLVAMQILAYGSLVTTMCLPILLILLLFGAINFLGFLILTPLAGLVIGGTIGWLDRGYIQKIEEAWRVFKKVNPVRVYLLCFPRAIFDFVNFRFKPMRNTDEITA